jgi:hypothetical protein
MKKFIINFKICSKHVFIYYKMSMLKSNTDIEVKLNVGGVQYSASRNLLKTCFYFRDFAFSEDKVYFIDRDGQLFTHVLKFLRTLDKWVPPADVTLLSELLTEARFFSLVIMETKIREYFENEKSAGPIMVRLLHLKNGVDIQNTWNAPQEIEKLIDKLSEGRFSKPKILASIELVFSRITDALQAMGYGISHWHCYESTIEQGVVHIVYYEKNTTLLRQIELDKRLKNFYQIESPKFQVKSETFNHEIAENRKSNKN